MSKRELFKVEGENVTRIRKHCPKCGPGVFLAEHKDRVSCGKCGYTEFKGGSRKQESTSQKPTEKTEQKKEENKKE